MARLGLGGWPEGWGPQSVSAMGNADLSRALGPRHDDVDAPEEPGAGERADGAPVSNTRQRIGGTVVVVAAQTLKSS